MLSRRIVRRWLIGTAVAAIVVTVAAGNDWTGTPGEARLVAFESLSATSAGETCEWEVAAPQHPSYAASLAAPGAATQFSDADARLGVAKRQPLTFIQDPYPNFSSIAVDAARNEIVMTDENRFRIMVYDRTAVTPASARLERT